MEAEVAQLALNRITELEAEIASLRKQVEQKDYALQKADEIRRAAVAALRSSRQDDIREASKAQIDEKIVKKRAFALYKKHITSRGYAWAVGCSLPADVQLAVATGMREGYALGVDAVLSQMEKKK